jgi:hypothetical protein
MEGMWCDVIPTPLSSSRTCSFTQFHNREYILTHQTTEKKLEETQSELQGTKSELQETKSDSKRRRLSSLKQELNKLSWWT